MNINVGTPDRVLRIVIGLALVLGALFSGMALFDGPILKYGAVIVGIVLMATGTLRFCPIYAVLGTRTCRI